MEAAFPLRSKDWSLHAEYLMIHIVIDTREQVPFEFSSDIYKDVKISWGTLPTGDYSLAGMESWIAVERKSLQDLVACAGKERERFTRELDRARGLDAFCVVVESPIEDLVAGKYKSGHNPHSICQSIASFMANRRAHFIFAASRANAEYFCWSFLNQYLKTCGKKFGAMAGVPLDTFEKIMDEVVKRKRGKLN